MIVSSSSHGASFYLLVQFNRETDSLLCDRVNECYLSLLSDRVLLFWALARCSRVPSEDSANGSTVRGLGFLVEDAGMGDWPHPPDPFYVPSTKNPIAPWTRSTQEFQISGYRTSQGFVVAHFITRRWTLCREDGDFLQDPTVLPTQCEVDRFVHDWLPFENRLAFDWAHYHYVTLQSSAPEIVEGTDLWSATSTKHSPIDGAPWKNAKEIFDYTGQNLRHLHVGWSRRDENSRDRDNHGTMFVPIVTGSDQTTVSVVTGHRNTTPSTFRSGTSQTQHGERMKTACFPRKSVSWTDSCSSDGEDADTLTIPYQRKRSKTEAHRRGKVISKDEDKGEGKKAPEKTESATQMRGRNQNKRPLGQGNVIDAHNVHLALHLAVTLIVQFSAFCSKKIVYNTTKINDPQYLPSDCPRRYLTVDMTIWDQRNDEGFIIDPNISTISDTEPNQAPAGSDAVTGTEIDVEDPFRATNIVRRTNQVDWRPMGLYVNNGRPDRAALHKSLAVAEIYEELDDLNEEIMAIVLAQNREVKRQLTEMKKEISDMRVFLPSCSSTS
ncbi:hypothetical protein EDB85DRAFT_1900284 [Lactarius pseudohatsudake]|nr:hypothetical protein EDB85DRAFT_1900284 [Lactarius pseudohatsudake]